MLRRTLLAVTASAFAAAEALASAPATETTSTAAPKPSPPERHVVLRAVYLPTHLKTMLLHRYTVGLGHRTASDLINESLKALTAAAAPPPLAWRALNSAGSRTLRTFYIDEPVDAALREFCRAHDIPKSDMLRAAVVSLLLESRFPERTVLHRT